MARLRAAVFSRESKGKGTSIDDQDRENLAACAELDAEIVVTLRDVVGASRFTAKQRINWPEITELVRSGQIDLLVVWEVSRADRTMDTWVPFVTACGDRGVRLHITSLEMTYDPRKAAHRKALLDMGSDAEHETGQLSERSRKGIRGAVLAGKAHGAAVFGYTRAYGPIVDGKRTFTEVRNEHIGVAVEIITRIAKRDPLVSIERDLNARPAEERGNRVWSRRSLKYVATNPAYVAIRRHRSADGTVTDAPGNWAPASDAPDWEAMFWRAQDVLNEPGRRTSGPSSGAKYLASHIMVCGDCVGPDGRPSAVTPTGMRYKCPSGCSSVPIGDADAILFGMVFALRHRTDVFELFGGDSSELAEVDIEVKRIERQIEQARDEYAEHGDGEAFRLRIARLTPDLDTARRRAAEARQANAAFVALTDLLDEDEEMEAARSRWDASPIIQRRVILRACFARIELRRASRRLSRHATPEQRLAMANERITVDLR